MEAEPIIFTLSNFTLPRREGNMTTSNLAGDSNSTSAERLLYPFFLTGMPEKSYSYLLLNDQRLYLTILDELPF